MPDAWFCAGHILQRRDLTSNRLSPTRREGGWKPSAVGHALGSAHAQWHQPRPPLFSSPALSARNLAPRHVTPRPHAPARAATLAPARPLLAPPRLSARLAPPLSRAEPAANGRAVRVRRFKRQLGSEAGREIRRRGPAQRAAARRGRGGGGSRARRGTCGGRASHVPGDGGRAGPGLGAAPQPPGGRERQRQPTPPQVLLPVARPPRGPRPPAPYGAPQGWLRDRAGEWPLPRPRHLSPPVGHPLHGGGAWCPAVCPVGSVVRPGVAARPCPARSLSSMPFCSFLFQVRPWREAAVHSGWITWRSMMLCVKAPGCPPGCRGWGAFRSFQGCRPCSVNHG